jgi:acyl-coenzyme A thioesterase 13
MERDFYRSTDFALSHTERVKAYLASITADAGYDGFDKRLLQQVELLDVDLELSQTLYVFSVQDFMSNKDGNLHGGAVATLMDNLSSTALITIQKPGFWDNFGISRSLAVIYHRAMPESAELLIRCSVLAAGRQMATVKAVIEGQNGVIHASCVHEKFAAPAPKL